MLPPSRPGPLAVENCLDPSAADLDELVALLHDCVHGGASVGFMAPLDEARARGFWEGVAGGVRARQRWLAVVRDEAGVVGTVQLVTDLPDNQTHRADLCKLLVHRRARRRGVGALLVRAAEAEARRQGRTVLVLDTVADSDADRLYRRLGWTPAGDVPRYARMPDGAWCTTRYFFRDLDPQAEASAGLGSPTQPT